MADSDKIREILSQLDPLDDDQWTSDGAPKVEVVMSLLGEKVTRQDIVNSQPDFNREKAGKPAETTDEKKDPEVIDEDLGDPVPVNTPVEFNEAEFLSWLAGVDKEDLEQVSADLKKELDSLASRQEALKNAASAIKTAQGHVKLRIKSEFQNSSDADSTRAYIESQTKARAERMGLRASVLKGLRLSELEGRSPLDAAMARKTQRGTARPAIPLVK